MNASECFDADILKGFDEAIEDGVDVISVSLGGSASDLFNDSVVIGSFHATKRGITVICSAGNSGPLDGSVENIAPWYITVAASTMDRQFPAYVTLANNLTFKVCHFLNYYIVLTFLVFICLCLYMVINLILVLKF